MITFDNVVVVTKMNTADNDAEKNRSWIDGQTDGLTEATKSE